MKQKILIVDDEESIRFSFTRHLYNASYDVLTAKDYVSALEIIDKVVELDLIITDIILRGHRGIDILKEVKERGLHCPVIIITGEPNIDTATDAVRLGAFDYLSKPILKETLLRVTHHALRHKSLIDEKERIDMEKEKYRTNLEAIFKSLNDAVITVDDTMRVIEANDAVKDICGFSSTQIRGKACEELLYKCGKLCLPVLLNTLKTKDHVKEYPIKCQHQDRPQQVIMLSTAPLMSRNTMVRGAVLVARDITRLRDLEHELKERYKYHHLIGKSRKMQDIYRLLEDLVDTQTTVLITGESGTGKELAARALHYKGLRASKPLVSVNCNVLSENLLESELFGHVKGAFTGAVRDKIGRFQMAHGGTIFLDEIGDITPAIQLKLLKVLQEKEFEMVGDANPIKVDVRVIAATNCDLKEKVRRGEFREDLYYRIKVIEIALPPLRERREDIPLLVDHFYRSLTTKSKKEIKGISDEVLSIFMNYPWPGNVRELEHAMEHAFVLCHNHTIGVNHLPAEIKEYSPIKKNLSPKGSCVNSEGILDALNKCGWNKAKAARLLGISRPSIYRKIEEYKLTQSTE
ncbi:MAG: sigma-54 dependent transcriptional regulator [bacterium]